MFDAKSREAVRRFENDLGICSLCSGRDPECRFCGGTGRTTPIEDNRPVPKWVAPFSPRDELESYEQQKDDPKVIRTQAAYDAWAARRETGTD